MLFFFPSIYESDPAEAMKQLQSLAVETNVNEAVRLGDIYAVLIIHNVKKENYKKVISLIRKTIEQASIVILAFKAHSYLEELRKRMPKMELTRYIKPNIIETIHKELNLPIPKTARTNGTAKTNGTDEDSVPESIGLKKKMDLNENDIMHNNGDEVDI